MRGKLFGVESLKRNRLMQVIPFLSQPTIRRFARPDHPPDPAFGIHDHLREDIAAALDIHSGITFVVEHIQRILSRRRRR